MKMIARLAALAGALCLGSNASARPFTIDDMLHAESIGDSVVDPSGRWLLYGITGSSSEVPPGDADGIGTNRTRLFVADLAHPGPGRLLDPADPGAVLVPYSFSPKGTRLAIGRLKDGRWQLGIVTVATGDISWADVGPEYDQDQTMLDWTSEDQVVAIAVGDARLPLALRMDHTLFEDLGAAWRTQQAGRVPSVTVVGSGRFVDRTPHVANRTLVLVDATDGATRVLETGDFRSLTLSPDRRVAALSEQTTSFNLVADQPLSEKDQLRRHRLVLVDLATGGSTDACAHCDIRTIKPLWRPDGRAILFGGIVDGAPQADLTAWTFDIGTRTLPSVLPKGIALVDAMSLHGPTDLARGWAEGRPILFARQAHRADGRFDWYRVDGGEARCLTCSLAQAGPDLVQAGHDAPVMMAGGQGWRLGGEGTTPAFRGEGAIDVPSGGLDRASSGLLTWHRDGDQLDVAIAGKARWTLRLPASAGLSIEAGSGTDGSVIGVRRFASGKGELILFKHGRGPTTIATVNAYLDGVDAPDAVRLVHRHADGTAATSWLFLPPGHRPDEKLPLVVLPYPGRILGADAPPATPPEYPSDNPRPFVGHGYAVLLPDVPPAGEKSGGHYSFTADILAAVDAAIATGHVDPARLGLYGHSFGGLTAALVATQTDRFKAIVASAGLYDLASQYGTFAPGTRLRPGEVQGMATVEGLIETFQPQLWSTPWSDPAPYLASSAVFYADRIHTPMLIQAADADAVSLQQGEELFSALHRQGKDAVLLSYWGEDHVLASSANIRDFHERMFAWFDCHFAPVGRDCSADTSSP